MTLTVTVTSATGQINVPVTLAATINSDTTISNIEWLCNQQVNYTVDQAQRFVYFTPSQNGEYTFTITVWNANNERASASGKVTVGSVTPTPTPTPTPVPTGTLWSSTANGKWNDGVKRTITVNEGGQKPNDKSIFCAASGNPKLVIDGNGVAHLVSGSGGVDNLSIRLRSRHQGECNNVTLEPAKRFGGHGWAVDKSGGVGFKTEDYHNVHSNSHDFNSGISIGETWHHVKFTLVGAETTFTLDGKFIGKVTCQDKGDISLLPKNSYIWLRLNNDDHGRIYIMAINVNSQLDLDFKFEPSQNSIAFKNVELKAL